MRGCDRFQVFQNAALQVVDLVKALRAQESRRFFAAYATGAKHSHPWLFAGLGCQRLVGLGLLLQPARQLGETPGVGVQRPDKGANRYLIVVAGIDHHHVRLRDQRVPVLRFDILARHPRRVDVRPVHGDDFGFEPDLHAVEGGLVGPRLFVLQVGQSRVGAQPGQHRCHPGSGAGNRAVDAFMRQQQRALHLVLLAHGKQRCPQLPIVGQIDELVEGGSQEAGHGFSRALAVLVGLYCRVPLERQSRPDLHGRLVPEGG